MELTQRLQWVATQNRFKILSVGLVLVRLETLFGKYLCQNILNKTCPWYVLGRSLALFRDKFLHTEKVWLWKVLHRHMSCFWLSGKTFVPYKPDTDTVKIPYTMQLHCFQKTPYPMHHALWPQPLTPRLSISQNLYTSEGNMFVSLVNARNTSV